MNKTDYIIIKIMILRVILTVVGFSLIFILTIITLEYLKEDKKKHNQTKTTYYEKNLNSKSSVFMT